MLDGRDRVDEAHVVAIALGDRALQWRALQRVSDFILGWDDGAHALEYMDRLLELARIAGPPGAEPLAEYTRGAAYWLFGDAVTAGIHLTRSLELFRRLGPGERIPSPLNLTELPWRGVSGLVGPRMMFEETLQPFSELSTGMAVAHVLVNQGAVARLQGDLVEARRLIEEGVGVVEALGESQALAQALVRLGYLDLAEDEVDAGRAAFERALELRRRGNDRRGIGIALAGLGVTELAAGDNERAGRALDEARELFRRAGDRWGLASTLWRIADLRLAQGDLDAADRALEETLTVIAPTRRQRWVAHTLYNRAEVAVARGERELADGWYARARALYVETHDLAGLALVDGVFEAR
jgi:tetratricopeptide (TPR) repeat protein